MIWIFILCWWNLFANNRLSAYCFYPLTALYHLSFTTFCWWLYPFDSTLPFIVYNILLMITLVLHSLSKVSTNFQLVCATPAADIVMSLMVGWRTRLYCCHKTRKIKYSHNCQHEIFSRLTKTGSTILKSLKVTY